MNPYQPDLKPKLRHVEARAVEVDGGGAFLLHDPTNLAEAAITVTEPALFILAHFDGETTLDQVRASFAAKFGQPLPRQALADLTAGLERARLLAGESFERYYAELEAEYLAAPVRPMHSAEALGLDGNAEVVIAEMLASAPPADPEPGWITGVIAPHLDYPRGRICYAAAYNALRQRSVPKRVIILGTNHFGRATSVVASSKDFATPLGVTRADREFLSALEGRCGPLRTNEFDHANEHSVELQLLICQHLWGSDAFTLVAVLCPDPCGPSGTMPYDGRGVDLRDFAAALQAQISADSADTLIIAGADLSHVGMQFGDDRPLDDDFCAEIHDRDALVLAQVAANRPEEFLTQAARDDNPTRICSAGCIFATMSALSRSRARVLRYHQAIDDSGQLGVTCAAAVFVD